MAATPPPYEPNVVNQTVTYNGQTWKGNPGSGWSTIESTMTPEEWTRKQQELYAAANKPVIESLEASKPEITSKFQTERERLEAEKAPLEARYQNLLDQVTQMGAAAEKRESTATTREFGRRGISTLSGLFDTTLNERLLPITQNTQGQLKDIGFQRESDLRNITGMINALTPQEVEALRQVSTLMAQIQSGGNTQAIQAGMQLYQLQRELEQRALDRQAQIDMASQRQQQLPNYMTVGRYDTVIDPSTGKVIFSGSGGVPTGVNNYSPTGSGHTGSSGGNTSQGGYVELIPNTQKLQTQFGGSSPSLNQLLPIMNYTYQGNPNLYLK